MEDQIAKMVRKNKVEKDRLIKQIGKLRPLETHESKLQQSKLEDLVHSLEEMTDYLLFVLEHMQEHHFGVAAHHLDEGLYPLTKAFAVRQELVTGKSGQWMDEIKILYELCTEYAKQHREPMCEEMQKLLANGQKLVQSIDPAARKLCNDCGEEMAPCSICGAWIKPCFLRMGAIHICEKVTEG